MSLRDGEILPVRVLDDALPDRERVNEATGNEDVTLERAYRLAALPEALKPSKPPREPRELVWRPPTPRKKISVSGLRDLFTLVCTKNRASHERRLKQYAKDLEWMRSLAERPPVGEKSAAAAEVRHVRETLAAAEAVSG